MATTPPGGGHGDSGCARTLCIGNQTSEVPVRTLVAGCHGDRQRPLGRDPALRFLDAFGDQIRKLTALVAAFGPRWRRHASLVGFELVHDLLDGPGGGTAAVLGGGSLGPELLIGRNDVHTVPHRLQWNSPVVAAIGWRLHRRHGGSQFLIDTTNTGWMPLVGTFSWPRTDLAGYNELILHTAARGVAGEGRPADEDNRHQPRRRAGCST